MGKDRWETLHRSKIILLHLGFIAFLLGHGGAPQACTYVYKHTHTHTHTHKCMCIHAKDTCIEITNGKWVLYFIIFSEKPQ